MIFEVLKEFETETPEGTFQLKEGQRVRLSKEEAIPLIQDGLIHPIEKVAYRIYSNILQAYLWVIETDADMHTLRGQDVSEAIYTKAEIQKLKGVDKEHLKAVHEVKTVFENSKVEEVTKRNENP